MSEQIEGKTVKISVYVSDETDAAMMKRMQGVMDVPGALSKLVCEFKFESGLPPRTSFDSKTMEHLYVIEVDKKRLSDMMVVANGKGRYGNQEVIRSILDHIFLKGTFSVTA